MIANRTGMVRTELYRLDNWHWQAIWYTNGNHTISYINQLLRRLKNHYTLYKYPIDQVVVSILQNLKNIINSFCLHAPVKQKTNTKKQMKRQKSPSLPNTYVFILYVDAPTHWLCETIDELCICVCFLSCYSLRPPADSWYQNYTKCHRRRTRGIPDPLRRG